MKVVRVKFILIVFILSVSVYTSYSQKLTPQQRAVISKDLAHYIFSDSANYCYEMGEQNFAISGNDTFYNPDGFHLLYRLKNGNAERMDKSCFHGHNFGRIMFIYLNKIYLIGGYGLFTTNNIIESFDPTTREWNFVASKGDRPEFIRGILFKNDSIVYLFNTYKSGNNAEPDILDTHYYLYNIHSNTWSKFKNDNSNFSKFFFLNSFVLKDYVVAFSLIKTLIISRKDNNCILVSNGDLPIQLSNTTIYNIDKNTITYSFIGSVTNNLRRINLKVDSLYSNRVNEALPLIIEKNPVQSQNILLIFSFSILILLFGTLIVLRKYNKSKKISEDLITDKTPNKLVETLLQLANNKVTVEELDHVFEIDHMEAESKKSKRHRIITQLDQDYPGLIIRIKDESDKRKFIYHIDKQFYK